jgi:SAM-dependent methyltransferase
VVDGRRVRAYRSCTHCGTVFSDPSPTEDEIEAHYRSKFESGNYELVRRFALQYRRVHLQLADWIGSVSGKRVLDVGCFTGELLEILAERGADVYGLELQPEAVAIANERLDGRVFQADVLSTSFPPGPYDVITMMGLIEHVLEPRRLVRRAHDLLSPGGRLYLETPNAASSPARVLRGRWPPLAPIEHIHLFSDSSLAHLLTDEGFEQVQTRAHVKRLPSVYVYEQLANFGGRGWQRAATPLRLLGEATLPFYVGEMLVSARRGS